MNDINTATPSGKPSSVGATVFWILVVLLAGGIAGVYFYMDSKLREQNDTLSNAIKKNDETQRNLLTTELGKQEGKWRQEVAILTEKLTKQETTNKELKVVIADVSNRFAGFVEKQYKDEKQRIETDLTKVRDDLSVTSAAQQKTERDVKYMKEDLDKRLKNVDESLASLSGASGELKKEFASLQADVNSVKGSAGENAVAIQKFNDRTRLFELKIMAEKAREAAKAAEKGDYQSLFERLNSK